MDFEFRIIPYIEFAPRKEQASYGAIVLVSRMVSSISQDSLSCMTFPAEMVFLLCEMYCVLHASP